MGNTTATRELQRPIDAQTDQTAVALGRYLDEHGDMVGRERALYTLAGLVSADSELLQRSGDIDPNDLIAQRELVYTIACSELFASSPRDIAYAVEMITDNLHKRGDTVSIQVASTLSALRPVIAQPQSSVISTARVAEIAGNLYAFKPTQRVVKGIVVTAVTAALAAGVAPKAAAETIDTTDKNTTTTSAPAATSQGEVSKFFNAVFDEPTKPQTTETTDPTTPPTETADTTSSEPAPQTSDQPATTTPDVSPQPSTDNSNTEPSAAQTSPTAPSESQPTPSVPGSVVEAPQDNGPSSVGDGLSEIFNDTTTPPAESQDATVQAAAELIKAYDSGDSKTIDKTIGSIEERLGSPGLFFTYLGVIDNPASDQDSEAKQEDTKDEDKKEKVDKPANKEASSGSTHKDVNLAALDALGKEGAEWKNRAYVVERFIEEGYTAENGIGFAGRFVIESGTEELKPDVKQNEDGPGRGIAQWGNAGEDEDDRARDRFGYHKEDGHYRYGTLRWFAEKNNQDWIKIETQVNFVFWELKHTERRAANALKSAGHDLEKSAIASLMYERPASWLAKGKARAGAIKDTFEHAEVIQHALNKKIKSIRPEADKDKADDKKQDDANGACPAGTDRVEEITEGWTRGGDKKKITLCAIPGTRVVSSSATPHWEKSKYDGTTAADEKRIAVNAKIAKETLRMAKAAKADGITLQATIGYRSLEEQCSIVIKKHARPDSCPGWVKPVSGNWTSSSEFSDHMLGRSIDFYGKSVWWMKKKGPKFGFVDNVYRATGTDQPHFTNKG